MDRLRRRHMLHAALVVSGAVPGLALGAAAWWWRRQSAAVQEARVAGFAAGYEARIRDDVEAEPAVRLVREARRPRP